MSAAALLCVLGIAVAVSAHVAIKVAERRASQLYQELAGEEAASKLPDDEWKDVRVLAGGWGCLVTALEFIRGVGLVVALVAALYLVAGD